MRAVCIMYGKMQISLYVTLKDITPNSTEKKLCDYIKIEKIVTTTYRITNI